jgi:hypothetical protein
MQQASIPTLTDRLPDQPPIDVDVSALLTEAPRPAPPLTQPTNDFLQFFWVTEIMRQQLLSYEYAVVRKIELYQGGGARLIYVFPPYGTGEPGTKLQQSKLSLDSTSSRSEIQTASSCFEVALAFFKHKRRMEQVRKQLLESLSDEQKEALRWTPAEQLSKLIQA